MLNYQRVDFRQQTPTNFQNGPKVRTRNPCLLEKHASKLLLPGRVSPGHVPPLSTALSHLPRGPPRLATAAAAGPIALGTGGAAAAGDLRGLLPCVQSHWEREDMEDMASYFWEILGGHPDKIYL